MKLKSIRMRLLIAFLSLVGLVMVMLLINITSIMRINTSTEEVVYEDQQALIVSQSLATNMAERTSLIQSYLTTLNPSYLDEFNAGIEESIAIENKGIEIIQSESLEQLINEKISWGMATNELIDLIEIGEVEQAETLMEDQIFPLSLTLIDGFGLIANEIETDVNNHAQEVIRLGKSVVIFSSILAGIALISGVVIALITSRNISRPLKEVTDRMHEISLGELNSQPLLIERSDEIGKLVRATNSMNDRLTNMMNQLNSISQDTLNQSQTLNQSSDMMESEIIQIAATMQELASGSESQAQTATELATSMDSFTQVVESTNKDSAQVYQASESVLSLARKGDELMGSSTTQMEHIDKIVKQAVNKMSMLDNQTQEISKLVEVIKDIANQTNLLALNAAIEAARAGEQGKGFAVVANEVRKLAEQVSEAVTDITEFVGTIQTESKGVTTSLEEGYEEVEKGTTQIVSTKKTFESILNSVQGISQGIGNMSSELKNVAKETREMNSAVDDIAAVAEESAAGVEQTAASSQQIASSVENISKNANSLVNLSDQLDDLISKFKIK
ncbi:methyl-accepting chemotaxis protein [Lacticigenium naphthae]|uniref:methyl-accepting chemotaxis protein n=1 Tax=Lacticigenium naphthae TaxID=515351 RepID=UPI0003F64072|nr:methyl-accepting chemotaxis protein [Lacticigenium naphthae]